MAVSVSPRREAVPSQTRRGFLGVCLAVATTAAAPAFCAQNVQPAFSLKGTVYEQAGNAARVDPVLLYAISCVESAVDSDKRRGFIRPYPWTLRSSEGPFYGKNRADTERELRRLLRFKPREGVDIGLAQVNTRWHGHRVDDVFDLLDPLTNLTVAAQILNEGMKRFPNDAYRAIGSYHSGDPTRAHRYARYVIRVYTSLKQ